MDGCRSSAPDETTSELQPSGESFRMRLLASQGAPSALLRGATALTALQGPTFGSSSPTRLGPLGVRHATALMTGQKATWSLTSGIASASPSASTPDVGRRNGNLAPVAFVPAFPSLTFPAPASALLSSALLCSPWKNTPLDRKTTTSNARRDHPFLRSTEPLATVKYPPLAALTQRETEETGNVRLGTGALFKVMLYGA
ncbi:hypothetical protein AXG93_3016s1270 [Marchantia polymorpha subsp. ruderalis]|uniref:Uncharacterized protein n=1 Tax=Marchantia polymorpha subsp. ruderalis TaxID=1480154 RepID=A0A176WDA6_MARPO|nr:hypothetical protein AXG93_3016s1270 [Marchantia polymorpha subsp. ruderalis]